MDRLDQLMANPPATTSLITGEQDPLDSVMDTYIGSQNSKVNATLNLSVDTNPVEYARKKRIANLLGTPVEAVDALPQDAERAAKIREIQDNTKDAPKLRELYSDADFARLASTDSGVLAKIEKAFRALTTEGWGKSTIQDELGELNYRAMLGTITSTQNVRRKELKSIMQKLDMDAEDGSTLNYVLRQTGYTAGQLVSSAREGGKGGLAGAVAGAGTAAVFGQLGPQAALPEEIITVPGATLFGARTGYIAASTVYNYRMEAGFAFDEFADMKDTNGQVLPRDVAVGAAAAVGLLNAGLETVGDVAMARLFPGFDKLLTKAPKEAVKQMLAKPTVRAALAAAGRKWLTAASAEGITEALQELSVIIGREAVQGVSGQPFAPDSTQKDVERIGQSGLDAFVGALGVGSAPSGYRAYRDVREAQRMQQNQAFIQALGNDTQASELAKIMPEKYRDFVAAAKKDGPVENIYIPAEQFQRFFQSQGIDPAEVASQVGAANYIEAVAAGSDVVIPIENYAEKLAGSQFHAGLAADIRLRQGEATAREYELYLANREAQQKEMQARMEQLVADQEAKGGINQAVEQAVADIEQQLIVAGAEPSTARSQATLMRGIAVLAERETIAQAAREGRQATPEEVYNNAAGLWERYNLVVSRPLPDVLTKDTRSDISIDPLLDRLRKGDFPQQREIYGKSLIDFLRERGGVKPIGELTDVDKGRGPFEKNLIQPNGMTLDEAAEAAVEAGYLQGRNMSDVTENDIVAAIEAELSGQPTFSDYDVNPELYALEKQLDSLQEYLSNLGIDLSAITDNAEVRKLLDQAAAANPKMGEEIQRYMQGLQTFYQGERIPDADYRVMRREFDNLNEAEQRVFDQFIASRPDGEQLLKRLQELKGTPWALQATEGIFVRQSILIYANGNTPDFQSMFDNNQVKTARELIKTRGIEGMFMYLDAKGYVGDAAKPINNVSSSFLNCNPSLNCAKYCYATEGHYRYALAVVKSEMVTLAVEMDYARAAKRTAAEYKATAEFANNKALRLFDKGDGNAAWLPFIQSLNNEGVRVHVFSKVPSFLRKVPAMNLRLLSVDESNLQMADSNPDLPVAMVYGGTAKETEALAKMVERKQIQVVLPIKIGRKVFDQEKIKKLKSDVPGVGPYICPIDGGIKKIGPQSDEKAWNCTKCDKNGGLGCYHGTVTKAVLESAETKPLTNQQKASRILELRSLINEITRGNKEPAGTAGAVANAGRGQPGRLPELLSEVDALLGDLLRDYEPDAETRNAFQGPGGIAQENRGVQEDQRNPRRVIPIRKLYQSAGVNAYQTDLFGVPTDFGKNLDTGKPAQGAGADLAGTYATQTEIVNVGTKELGAGTVKTPQQAAQALAYLARGAVEHFDALVTDANGKPLAIVGSFKGAIAQAAVYPATLAGEAYRIPGAANIWFAHNHPSGKTELSQADMMLGEALKRVFEGSQIQYRGLFAIGKGEGDGRRWVYEPQKGAAHVYGATTEPKRKKKVPVVDRLYVQEEILGPPITTPSLAKEAAKNIAGGKSGAILVDSQMQPRAFIEFGDMNLAKLRAEGRMDALWRAVSKANAAAVFLTNSGDYTEKEMANVAAFFRSAEVNVLDVMTLGDTIRSMASESRLQEVQTFYQSALQPTFFSALERAISGAKQDSAPAKDWLAIIQKLPGVKKEEIEWTGLREYLELRGKEKVTRAELLQYMIDNGVQVDEVMLGEQAGDHGLYVEQAPEGNWYVYTADDEVVESFDTEQEAEEYVNQKNQSDTKYGRYTLPGAKDYRELLLTLPVKQTGEIPPGYELIDISAEDRAAGIDVPAGEVGPWRFTGPNVSSRVYKTRKEALAALLKEAKSDQESGTPLADYRSSHWNQANVLAHIRFNERRDADGKRVLFIEEIQSDWAQEGRKKGFGVKDATPLTPEEDRELMDLYELRGDRTAEQTARMNALNDRLNASQGKPGVPAAPFVGDTKAWVALAVKRMIRYAAENGFDKVAFVNGEQSADRYSLSKAVNQLGWATRDDGGKFISLALSSNVPVQLIVDAEGKVTSAKGGLDQAKGRPLDELFGKDMAQKIMSEASGDLEGEGLNVGGEGMKSFYDKIVPQVVSDVLKKVGGGKMEAVQFDPEQIASNQQRQDYVQGKIDFPDTVPMAGFTITEELRNKALGGLPLFQGEMDDKRGYIQFGADRKFNIVLLEKANLSTFLHETGHFYLEVMGDLAEAGNASDQIKADYATILNWMGVKNRGEITTKHHEMFARANEAYLMEGNAPSAELRGVFQRFKSWLNWIYGEISKLNVRMNDDVRAVFDRIYATDAEIEAAKADVEISPLLLDAATAGLTEAEFEAYRNTIEQVSQAGKEALEAKLMREYLREQKAWWKAELESVRQEVAAEVDQTPVYRAFAALTEGKIGDTPIKLNKQALIDKYGVEYVKRLPRALGRVYTTEGGMDADAAANFLGFNSGDELIQALVGMKPRREYIEAEAQRVMRERYGDILTDGSISEEARIALHNSQRENVLMFELRALRKKQREVAPFVRLERDRQAQERKQAVAATEVPPAQAFREAAKGMIGQTSVRNLNPYAYLLAGRKAAREAFQAMAKGDYATAAIAKQREILNHFLYLEGTKARQEADKILKYMRKFEGGTTRQQMGKAGHDYLDQIDAILERYEFARVTNKALDRRKSLALWVAEQEAQGNEPAIDIMLLDETRRVNYREIPVDELRAVRDAVKNIEHLARLKNKLQTKRGQIEFQEAIDELVASAQNNFDAKEMILDPAAKTRLEEVKDRATRLDAMLIKMEQLVEWLDGGNVNGPWHTYLWNPIAEAQVAEFDLTREITQKITEALQAMPKEQRLSMLDTFEIPGMGRVTRKFLVSIAMNVGNAGNLDKMLRGFNWNIETVRAALGKLNRHDMAFVQNTLDTINSLWPRIAELEKVMTGLEPPKVENAPFEVRDDAGNLIGVISGYYPLVYDPRKSTQGAEQETGNLGQLFEEGYVRATTPKGHTKTRTEGFAAPLLLDFEQVTTQHLAKVIKDLTHRQAIVAANKILTNQEIRKVLQETMGTAYEKQMLPWLRSVVNDRNGGSTQGLTEFSRFMMSLRANVVAATMGFKATTMIAQVTGLSQSLDKVKARHLSQALIDYLRHPIAMTKEVRELSGEMRHRADSLDRDIRDQLRKLTGQSSSWAQAQKFAFHGIAIADAMVSYPTWMGAYRQALAAGADQDTAILEADAAVRLTQGAGGQKDLAAIQRNNELAKMLTMFYSYFSVLYSRMRDMGRSVQDIKDMPRFLARAFFTVVFPAIMGELILGRGPDDDEDEALWVIRKVLLYPLLSVPVLRDIASSIDSGFDYRFSPVAASLEKIGKLVNKTAEAVKEGDIEWGDYALNVAQTIGYVFGIAGTAQVSASGKYLWRVAEGDEQPENLAELLYYASVGKKAEK